MKDMIERALSTRDKDENIMGMVTFPCNEEAVLQRFQVDDLKELYFADGMATYLTVPEFNQAMQDADGRMQKIGSAIDATVRFLETKKQDGTKQKAVSEMVWLGFEDAAVWEFCMQDSYRPADEHVELSFSGMLLQVTYHV